MLKVLKHLLVRSRRSLEEKHRALGEVEKVKRRLKAPGEVKRVKRIN